MHLVYNSGTTQILVKSEKASLDFDLFMHMKDFSTPEITLSSLTEIIKEPCWKLRSKYDYPLYLSI